MTGLVLILGGARSGKSDFAQSLAERRGGPVLFIATATATDPEMAQRITAHQRSRPPEWITLEAPVGLAAAVDRLPEHPGTIVVDCLTLLTANLLTGLLEQMGEDSPDLGPSLEDHLRQEIDGLARLAECAGTLLLVVSNEVGEGIVPADRLTRLYRDALGRGNAYLARKASRVYLMVAGLPVDVKALAREPGNGAAAWIRPDRD